MSRTEGSRRREDNPATLRALQSVVTFWILTGVGLFLVGDILVRGRFDIFARSLPIFLLVIWAAWIFLVHSSIRSERDRVVVTNLARVHSLPWSRVRDIVEGAQIGFELDSGRTVEAWGGPFLRRKRGAATAGVDALRAAHESALLRERDAVRRRASDPMAPQAPQPASSWDVIALGIGAVLVVAVIVVAVLPA